MSGEAFRFFDTDRFFRNISVADEDGCGKENILRCLTNYRSGFCNDRVIEKRGLGSQIGTFHTLILEVFLSRVDVPRGGGSMRGYESINHQGRGAREGYMVE